MERVFFSSSCDFAVAMQRFTSGFVEKVGRDVKITKQTNKKNSLGLRHLGLDPDWPVLTVVSLQMAAAAGLLGPAQEVDAAGG